MTLPLAHGDRVPIEELASAWSAEPVVIALALAGLGLFLQAWTRLRRRGRADHAGWSRLALFLAGEAVLVLALVSPLDAAGEEYLLSAHMLQHVLVADVAPALLLVAVRGPLVFFLLPPAVLRPLASAGPLRAFVSWLARPMVGIAVWATVIAVWHVPALYDFTLTHGAVHDLEHASFFVAGLLVWNLLVDPARRGVLSVRARLGLAVGLFAAGQVLADVLIFSFEPLYPAYAAQDERLFGLSPLRDQQAAGVVMMVEQALTLGTCAAFLLLRAPGRTGRRHAVPRATA
jgi:cytochrome c oxidase assembly factor CtaG